jgi:hypothetical protein
VILTRSDPATNVIPEPTPWPGDRVLTKTSMDVFTSTRLAEELRVGGIETLVITGVLTDACVESSARHAAERGFQVIVVDDACAAWEEAFHAASLRSVARYFARIASTRESWKGSGGRREPAGRPELLVRDDAGGPVRQHGVGRPRQIEADAAQRELRQRDVLHAAQAVEVELQLRPAALELEQGLADRVVELAFRARVDRAERRLGDLRGQERVGMAPADAGATLGPAPAASDLGRMRVVDVLPGCGFPGPVHAILSSHARA